MIDLSSFQLGSLIVHRIPQKLAGGGDSEKPTLSDVAGPQQNDVRAFFNRRIRTELRLRGHDIERDSEVPCAVPGAIERMLDDPDVLAPESRDVAQHLFAVQNANNSPGILVVGSGVSQGRPSVAILKLEHERGIRAEETRENGQLSFLIHVHDDLMLTDKTVLFKAAAFARKKDGSLVGIAADLQGQGGIAHFFLSKFLGCRLTQLPSVLTERFLEASEAWINSVPDPERLARYEIALVAHLQSSDQAVSPDRFARSSLNVDDHQPYKEAIVARGVPWVPFTKDTSAIANRLKRVAYNFQSGIKLIATPEVMDERVSIEQVSERRSRVTFEDELRKVHSRAQ
jgi:hypothetical protein